MCSVLRIHVLRVFCELLCCVKLCVLCQVVCVVCAVLYVCVVCAVYSTYCTFICTSLWCVPPCVGFDHINRNAPVLIRTPKLTRFEPAQYWGGGPPGNSVVLNPFPFFFFFSC